MIENKPRLVFMMTMALGLAALLASLYALVMSGEPADKDNLFGLVAGLVCVCGTTFLYRETTTTLDRRTGKLIWRQRSLTGEKTDSARLDQITDVVIGRPVSDQSGGASRVCLLLGDRSIPLMFGFTALGQQGEIRTIVKKFVVDA